MFGNCDVTGYRLTEVVDDQPRPGFLFHVFAQFGVEVKKVNRVFELPERGFLAPPEVVEFLDYCWWEFITIQVGSQILKNPIRNFDAQDP